MAKPTAALQFSVIGFTVLWGALSVLLLGLISLATPLIVLGVALLLFVFLARFFCSRNLGPVSLTRRLPQRAHAGCSFVGNAEVRGTGASPILFVKIDDAIRSGSAAVLPIVDRHSASSFEFLAKVDRRGIHELPPPTLTSEWPFGLFESRRPLERNECVGESEIRILPAPFLPKRLAEHLNGLFQIGPHSLQASDPVSEFRLLREYQSGDPVKQIHWQSSLKHDDLLVREVDPPKPSPRAFGILLHSHVPEGNLVTPEDFETLLRITTGLLLRFQNSSVAVSFQQPPFPVRILRDKSDFESLLDDFASFARHPLSELPPAAELASFTDCHEVFVLGEGESAHWQPSIEEVLGTIHAIDARSVILSRRPRMKPHLQRFS